jgi:hypothetical protein
VRLEGLGKSKTFIDLIVARTRDLPATLPRVPLYYVQILLIHNNH